MVTKESLEDYKKVIEKGMSKHLRDYKGVPLVFESIYWGNDEENEEFSVTTYHIYPVLENPNATLMLRSELSVVRERHVEKVNDLLRKYLIEPEEV